MSQRWFYRLFGEEFGPVPFTELQRVVQSGMISAEDEVRPETESSWKMARSVPELSAVTASPHSSPEDKPRTAGWFYRLFGEEFGPVPFTELQRVVQSGMISAEDEVRPETESSWKMAQSVPELNAVTASLRSSSEDQPRTATDQWMCRISGLELGPLPFEELVAFAKSGQLLADDDVKHGTNGSWLQAGWVCRLMAAISSASSPQEALPAPGSTPRTPASKTSAKAPHTPTPQPEQAPTNARPTAAALAVQNAVAPIVRPTQSPSAVATTAPPRANSPGQVAPRKVAAHVTPSLPTAAASQRPAAAVSDAAAGTSPSSPAQLSASTTESAAPPHSLERHEVPTAPPVRIAPKSWSPPKARWQIPNVASAIQPLWDAARESESLPKLGGAIVLLALIWCVSWLFSAGDSGPKLYRAIGVLTLNGKPLPNAGVIFNPKDVTSTAKLATGRSDSQGRFTLQTSERPGAMPSDYQVAIYATEEPPQNMSRPDDFQMRPTERTPGEPPPELKPPKLLIPERYTKPKESGLAFTVSATTRNEFDIKLTGTPP